MFMFKKTTLGIIGAIAGSFLIGYCIYFDKKRRNDPDYKRKVKERRELQRLSQNKKNQSSDMDSIFLTEMNLGETYISSGELEKGVEHITNALMLCGQPARVLQILEYHLPPPVFAMLLKKLQFLRVEAEARQQQSVLQGIPAQPVIHDDVE